MFISPSNPNNVVIAASWIPFEGPEGGPNYWEWDPTAQYSLNVDNDGDAVADFTYTLTSETSIPNGNTFLYNTGPITSLSDGDWNMKQKVTITRAGRGRRLDRARRQHAHDAEQHRQEVDAELHDPRERGDPDRSAAAPTR